MIQNLVAKKLTKKSEFIAMAELRCEVYCKEKKWVAQKSCGLEIDRYDTEKTVYHGVFYKDRLAACQRLNPRPAMWMIDPDGEFNNIGSTVQNIRYSPDSAEASRLAIHQEFRSSLVRLDGKYHVLIILLLFKVCFNYCKNNKIRYIYGGSYVEYIDYYRQFAPFKRLSEPQRMKDGSDVEVAVLDLLEFERGMRNEMSLFFTSQTQILPQ